jgi:hypothetical protein
MGIIWGIAKAAATTIPWGRLVENAPAVVDLVGRAKERLKITSRDDLVEGMKLLQEENLKLERMLLEAATHLQKLEETLNLVAHRQKIWVITTVVALLMAISSLLLCATR